ncbi:phospho-N-acetylmuramoyl-pentapeptide-transferase, partial [Flavobacteriaceae bacterium]|nr:phospho-N-acetylmuramoyl-pentapeptide-transferase [Flavobacteriaceae bacterium]
MLYYLFEFLEQKLQFPGATLFQFLSFRASMAIILSSAFTLICGRIIIR